MPEDIGEGEETPTPSPVSLLAKISGQLDQVIDLLTPPSTSADRPEVRGD